MKIRFPKFKFLDSLSVHREMMVWIVWMSVLVAAIEVAWLRGALQAIYSSDFTKISVLIAAIFSWQTIVCVREVIFQTGSRIGPEKSSDRIESGWMWSDIVLSLGMIGTVIGFMIMLAGFAGVDFSDFDSVQGLITNLSAGMSTSLSTTLVGLVASVILKIQFFNLERIVKKRSEKEQIL